ncbi:MAG: rhomboid family intramembrane serine protease [Alphaproteobacteria bacterium]|nr:rhomboid family intramembrane serine protease [Alphaproteobacteria bacterium]
MRPASPPALNISRATAWLLGLNIAVHLARLAMPPELERSLIVHGGFAPSFFLAPGYGLTLPDEPLAWLTPVTYAFLHGDVMHLLINMGFLLAFGTAVERRLGLKRYLAFYLALGALALSGSTIGYWVSGEVVLVIGASGAVSGLFGAAARLMFAERARGLTMIGLFLGINLVFGVTGIQTFGGVRAIAWEAHAAGLVLGYLLFPLFDHRPSARAV